GCHPLGVEGQNLLVEAVEPTLPLGDQLGFEGAVAVAWCPQLEVTHITADRLPRMSVAAVLRSCGGLVERVRHRWVGRWVVAGGGWLGRLAGVYMLLGVE